MWQNQIQSRAHKAVEEWPMICARDVRPCVIDKMHVIHARRACRHAGKAGQAAVDMCYGRGIGWRAALQHVLDHVNSATRRVALIAEHNIGRTGSRAKPAMHTRAQDRIALAGRGVGKLRERELSLHLDLGVHAPRIEHALGVELLLQAPVQCHERRLERRHHLRASAQRGRRAK